MNHQYLDCEPLTDAERVRAAIAARAIKHVRLVEARVTEQIEQAQIEPAVRQSTAQKPIDPTALDQAAIDSRDASEAAMQSRFIERSIKKAIKWFGLF